MFLDGHNLDTVVSICHDARQHILTELIVRPHLFRILRHSDMAFVDEQGRALGLKVFFLEVIRFGWVPNLS